MEVSFLEELTEVHPENVWLLHGYTELSSERRFTFGSPLPILRSEMEIWLRDNGYRSPFLQQLFISVCRALDSIEAEVRSKSKEEKDRQSKAQADLDRKVQKMTMGRGRKYQPPSRR